MDLIDRQELMTKLHRMPGFEKTDSDKKMLYVEKSIIEQMPTVDAVEVVRCKDCKHISFVEGGLALCTLHYIGRAYEDYCSEGERRTDA